MRNLSTMGGGIEIQCACNIWNCQINVHHSNNKIIESFNNTGSCNITDFVTSILLTLVLILFIYTFYNHNNI